MIALILTLFTSFASVDLPPAEVQTGDPEAIWVPAGSVAPFVAGPFDEIVFEISGG